MNLNAKNKIYLMFGGIAGFFIIFALLLLNQSIAIKRYSDDIESHWMPNIVAINAINTAASDWRSTVSQTVISTDPEEMDEYEQTRQRLTDEIATWQAKYEPRIVSDKERTLYQKFASSYENYIEASKQALVLVQNGNKEKAAVQFKRNRSLFNALSGDLQQLVELNNKGSLDAAQQSAKALAQVKMVIAIGSSLLVMILIVFMALLRGKAKLSPYKLMIDAATKKITWSFLAIMFFFLAFSGVFYQQLTRVSLQINELNSNRLPSIIAVNALNTKISDYRITEALYVLSIIDDEMAQLDQKLTTLADNIAELRQKYSALISSEHERDLYTEFSRSYDDYIAASGQTMTFSRNKNSVNAGSQLRQSGVLFGDFRSILVDLVALNQRGGVENSYAVDAALQSLKIVTLGGGAFVLLLLTIVAQLVQAWLLDEPLDSAREGGSGTVLSIKMKLRLAFLGMVATFILFSLLINGLMQTMNEQTRQLESNWRPSIILINGINTLTGDYRIAEAQHILSTDTTEMLLWDKNLTRLAENIAKARARYEALISSEEERGIYQDFSHKYDEYLTKSDKMLVLSRKKDTVAATKELQHNRIIYDAFSADLLKLVNLNSLGGIESTHLNKSIFDEAQQIIFSVVLTIFMIAILFMIVFDKNISVALQRLTGLMRRLADGVMSGNNDSFKNRRDEIGQMADALFVVTETLQTLTNDSIELIDAARAGILSARVDAQRHPGEFGRIMAGMNSLIDVLSKPLGEVAQIMQNLALGDLEGRIEGDYDGELRILKSNVNRSLDGLVSLLTELSVTMQYMAQADLTHMLAGNYQGEFSVLKASTNQTIAQLIVILKEIIDSTAQSAVAITQTSEASKYVADAASRQMVAVENVSRTIEETAVSVNEIAQKAKQSSELACTTAQSAHDGQAQLNKLIELIQHIDAEYGRIEQITDEITRIADKTHLLSLNAGLEAMRAGEHGLGFGFVAQQIGQLAEEVSFSARDIGGVISSSGQKIRLGVHATQETQAAMEQIAQAAQASEANVQGISVAIIQQSAAVKSLTERVGEIRVSSETTASASEQISTTMIHLAQTVTDTAAQAKRFKLVD